MDTATPAGPRAAARAGTAQARSEQARSRRARAAGLASVLAALACGGAAHAQTITHTWRTAIVAAGTYTPSNAGTPGAIDPGEELAFFLDAGFNWPNPPAGTQAVGIGTFFTRVDPAAPLPLGAASGAWGPVNGIVFGNIAPSFGIVSNNNVLRLPTGGVLGIGSASAGGFNPALLDTSNPLVNLMRFRWTPSPALLNLGGSYTFILGPLGGPGDNALYYVNSVGSALAQPASVTTVNGSVTFTVVPGPGSLAGLVVVGVWSGARRRR